jgi:hypothetical protein
MSGQHQAKEANRNDQGDFDKGLHATKAYCKNFWGHNFIIPAAPGIFGDDNNRGWIMLGSCPSPCCNSRAANS